MKYLVGATALFVTVIVSFLVFSDGGNDRGNTVSDTRVTAPNDQASTPDQVLSAEVPAEPEVVPVQDTTVVPLVDQEAGLQEMAATARENLPSSVTDTLKMTDVVFLPRMRIMEYTYVTTANDALASARNMRALIEAGAERLCLEGREMFAMGVTLRNSFEDPNGTLFQRVYLLPEDCQQFY